MARPRAPLATKFASRLHSPVWVGAQIGPIEAQKVEGHKRGFRPDALGHERAEVASPVVSQPASPTISASWAARPRTASKHDSFLPHKQGERVQPAGSGGRGIDQEARREALMRLVVGVNGILFSETFAAEGAIVRKSL